MLVAVLVLGVLLFWQFGRTRPRPTASPVVVEENPRPVEPDRSVAFESVTDRTPMSLRDNAAYALLLDRARGRTPDALAGESRRDILLTHLWERPERYRGVPVHIDGSALRVLRYESKLSKTGWLYEAWIDTPDSGRFPYVCVFEEAPKGFPIGANVSERVVFNGYFLKIMKYEASDVARARPARRPDRLGPQPVGRGAGTGLGVHPEVDAHPPRRHVRRHPPAMDRLDRSDRGPSRPVVGPRHVPERPDRRGHARAVGAECRRRGRAFALIRRGRGAGVVGRQWCAAPG